MTEVYERYHKMSGKNVTITLKNGDLVIGKLPKLEERDSNFVMNKEALHARTIENEDVVSIVES